MKAPRQQKTCPGFLRKNVTVCAALTAAPITAPEVPLMPLGKSTAITGAACAFMASIIARAEPFDRPVETGAEQCVDHDIGAAQSLAPSVRRIAQQ